MCGTRSGFILAPRSYCSMNSVLEVIKKRRSWRGYEERQVPHEMVEACLGAANEAPSGMNGQPWRFVVVQDAAMRKRLFDSAYPKWRRVYERLMANPASAADAEKYGKMEDPVYYRAPTVVFVVGTRPIDCALACENMMLAAESLGLANCYTAFGAAIRDEPEVMKVLDLKEKEEIYGPILLGYPKGSPEVPPKKAPRVLWV